MIEAKAKLVNINPTANILLIDRTICEYDIQESKTDPIMNNYFDLKQPGDVIEIDIASFQRLNGIKEKILNEVFVPHFLILNIFISRVVFEKKTYF